MMRGLLLALAVAGCVNVPTGPEPISTTEMAVTYRYPDRRGSFQETESAAAAHCRETGLVPHLTTAERVNDRVMVARYECVARPR